MRKQAGLPPRYGHMFGERQWEYNRLLADKAHEPLQRPVVQKMYFDAGNSRRAAPDKYRERRYQVVSDTQYCVQIDGVDVTPPH